MRSSYRRHRLTLDRWGIALTVAGELQGSSRDAWRVHHDACAARMFDDALRAGIVGRTEVHTLFSDLLPPPLPVRHPIKMACIWSIVSDGSEVQLNGNC